MSLERYLILEKANQSPNAEAIWEAFMEFEKITYYTGLGWAGAVATVLIVLIIVLNRK
jgi:hypothetical protein